MYLWGSRKELWPESSRKSCMGRPVVMVLEQVGSQAGSEATQTLAAAGPTATAWAGGIKGGGGVTRILGDHREGPTPWKVTPQRRCSHCLEAPVKSKEKGRNTSPFPFFPLSKFPSSHQCLSLVGSNLKPLVNRAGKCSWQEQIRGGSEDKWWLHGNSDFGGAVRGWNWDKVQNINFVGGIEFARYYPKPYHTCFSYWLWVINFFYPAGKCSLCLFIIALLLDTSENLLWMILVVNL